jgi:hypothetical protein
MPSELWQLIRRPNKLRTSDSCKYYIQISIPTLCLSNHHPFETNMSSIFLYLCRPSFCIYGWQPQTHKTHRARIRTEHYFMSGAACVARLHASSHCAPLHQRSTPRMWHLTRSTAHTHPHIRHILHMMQEHTRTQYTLTYTNISSKERQHTSFIPAQHLWTHIFIPHLCHRVTAMTLCLPHSLECISLSTLLD